MNYNIKASTLFNALGIVAESLSLNKYYYDVSNHLSPVKGRFPELSVQIRDYEEAIAVYKHAKALFDISDYNCYCRWHDEKTGTPIGALEFNILYKDCEIFVRFYAFEYKPNVALNESLTAEAQDAEEPAYS